VLLPTSEAVGFLVNLDNPNTRTDTRNVEAAAQALGLRLHVQNASGEHDFGPAFESLTQRRVSGIFVNVDPIFTIGAPEPTATLLQRKLILPSASARWCRLPKRPATVVATTRSGE
jgi:DNA-binding LacI/PurR family transcriptional regulator